MTKLKKNQITPFLITGTIDKATGLTLIENTKQPGFKTFVHGFCITSPGTAWAEATGIKILDGEGNVFFTILRAALAGSNARVLPQSSNVSAGAAFADGSTTGSTLVVSPYGTTESTGTNPTITIWGVRIPA